MLEEAIARRKVREKWLHAVGIVNASKQRLTFCKNFYFDVLKTIDWINQILFVNGWLRTSRSETINFYKRVLFFISQ